MKVIGISSDSYDREYIVTVKHSELEQFLGLYYAKDKFKQLAVGDTVDLGRGYHYEQKIAQAMKTTQEFVRDNQAVVTAVLNGLNYLRIAEDAAKRDAEATS